MHSLNSTFCVSHEDLNCRCAEKGPSRPLIILYSISTRKGGLFGTSKALSVKSKATDNAESAITADNRIDVEAGKDGDGSLTIAGSTLDSGGDMSLKAAGDV